MREAFDPDGVERRVFVVDERYDALGALDEPWRVYRRVRLIHVSAGVLTVRTESSRWVVPPGHGLWLMANVPHCLSAAGPVRLYSLYADADAAPLPTQNVAVALDRLAEALLGAAADLPLDELLDEPFADPHDQPHDKPHNKPLDEPAERLLQVTLDRLSGVPAAPLVLQWPRDPRIQRIAQALNANPAEPAVLDDLAEAAGVTARTAARLFVKETSQTFGQWRQQLRLLVALERLGAGASVTQVALEVGYNDVSSFIAVFRDAFGDTPARYFR